MPAVLEKEYEVRYYDCDSWGLLKPLRLLQYCEDIAVDQSERLGIGVDYLLGQGMCWVLYQWNARFFNRAGYREKVVIKTYPGPVRKFYASRFYEAHLSSGEKVLEGVTNWFLLDIQKRRPLKMTPDLCRAYQVIADEGEFPEFEKPGPVQNFGNSSSFQVRLDDIDTNNHVNHIRYLEWSLETLSTQAQVYASMDRLSVQYLKECQYPREISVQTEQLMGGQPVTRHRVVSGAADIHAEMEVYWKP